MLTRVHRLWLLAALAPSAAGCPEPLVIGSAYEDAGNVLDGSSIGLDGGERADAGPAADASAQDAGALDAYVDVNQQIMLEASHALGTAQRWLSPAGPGFGAGSVQFAFMPAADKPEGVFIEYCPMGCVFSEIGRDGGVGARPPGTRPPEQVIGRYVLFNVGSGGTVFGSIFTENGTTNFNLQIEWGKHPRAEPLEEIEIAFSPFGYVPFTALRN